MINTMAYKFEYKTKTNHYNYKSRKNLIYEAKIWQVVSS